MSRRRLSDPTALDATAAAQAIRRGELSSEALVRACLERIGEREDEIGAWAHLDPDAALRQAGSADDALRAGRHAGPLHGVPVGVKDIFDTADLPTENGSLIFAGRRPAHDAAAVALLRAAGAIILGKTVTTELALLTPAGTRNPHDPTRTPGGSSSGSAAAVACGMVPAALGSQTAGSLIRPASYCGVLAFKPTLGLIPRAGVLMQSHTLDTVGVYGRSVEDLALLGDCLARFDADDAVSIRYSGPRLCETTQQAPPAEPRFAFVRTPAWADADPALHRAFAGLIQRLGSRVAEIDIPSLADVIEHQRVIQLAENAHYYGPLLRKAPELLSDGLKARLEAGLKIDAQSYIRAVAAREPAYRTVAEVLRDCDAILTPAATGPAPRNLETTGSPVFNGLWTYLGTPAVSLPLLKAEGLPLGAQLIGARREDGRLLRTARWLVAEVAPQM